MVKLLRRLADRIIARAQRDPYHHIIGPDGGTYMRRYWVLRPRKWLPFSIRVHHILRSDDDRALHDHPFAYCSVILRGGYDEVTECRDRVPSELAQYGPWYHVRRYTAGDVLFRRARSAHRLEIPNGTSAWTLFIMGPRTRQWGFYTPYGWVRWDAYLEPEEVAEQRAAHADAGLQEVV